MTTYEHRLEILPVKPGAGPGRTAEILDRFSAEGWEVLHYEAWPVKTGGSRLTGDEAVDLGLLVVMMRAK